MFFFEKRVDTFFGFEHCETDATALQHSQIGAAELPNSEMAFAQFCTLPPKVTPLTVFQKRTCAQRA